MKQIANKIHSFNQYFNSLGELTRFWWSVLILLVIAVIGAFVFHSVGAYFIGAFIVIWLRRI
jgi:hypothetical protein